MHAAVPGNVGLKYPLYSCNTLRKNHIPRVASDHLLADHSVLPRLREKSKSRTRDRAREFRIFLGKHDDNETGVKRSIHLILSFLGGMAFDNRPSCGSNRILNSQQPLTAHHQTPSTG